MALIAEEVVEEWLNRQGYFTIWGIRIGSDEMDLLALRFKDGEADLRHYEVQVSMRPASYISDVPKAIQESEGRRANSARRRPYEELSVGVDEWIEKKFRLPKKRALRDGLAEGAWTFHLVVHKVAHPEELEVFEGSVVSVVRFEDILKALGGKPKPGFTASGKDLVELMLVGRG